MAKHNELVNRVVIQTLFEAAHALGYCRVDCSRIAPDMDPLTSEEPISELHLRLADRFEPSLDSWDKNCGESSGGSTAAAPQGSSVLRRESSSTTQPTRCREWIVPAT